MKKIIGEFKTFITRGNVVDMAVGVLVGSSFTAIVNGLSNFILKPVINWILALIMGENSLSDIYTVLKPVYKVEELTNEAGEVVSQTVLDLTKSIYIDWGSFINAVINFLLIAVILFVMVKIINKLRDENKEFVEKLIGKKLTREQKAELKANGIKRSDRRAVEAYFAEKQRAEEEAAAKKAAAEAAAAEEAERLAREENPTAEDLLRDILAELREKA